MMTTLIADAVSHPVLGSFTCRQHVGRRVKKPDQQVPTRGRSRAGMHVITYAFTVSRVLSP